jgi:type II secretory pathway component PulF
MAELHYSYVAVDRAGRRVRGSVAARDEATAFAHLKADGFAPLLLRRRRAPATATQRRGLSARETAEFLSGLAELLAAGADIRTALAILGARFERPGARAVGEQLAADIGGGAALDQAFGRAFSRSQGFVAPMIAAAEAAGDLAGGLQRAAEVIQSRLKLRDQLITVLAYPTFVLISALASLFVVLLFIVPSIAPIAQELGGAPPLPLKVMIAASDFLHAHMALLGFASAAGLLSLVFAGRAGLLSRPMEGVLLDGPFRRTAGGLVFGAFAVSLGTMVTAGAPLSEALRLALRTVALAGVRRRLEPVIQAVRQGESLSDALSSVNGFPPPIIRLTAVGEASNAVGPMLVRSGRMAEESGLRRIEAVGRIAGPALIILLGALVGLLMGGLLSSVSLVGQQALG